VQIGWRVCYRCQHVEACLRVLATYAATFGGRTPPLAIVLEAKQQDLLVGTVRGVVGGARRPIFLFSFSYLFFVSFPWNLWCSIKKQNCLVIFLFQIWSLFFYLYFFCFRSLFRVDFFLILSFDIKLVRNWASWFFYEVITVSWPWLRVWNINLNWHQSFFRFFSYTDFLFQFHLSTLDFWKLSFMIFFTFIYKGLSRSRHLGLWFDGLALVTRVYFWVVFLRINIFFILSFSIGSI